MAYKEPPPDGWTIQFWDIRSSALNLDSYCYLLSLFVRHVYICHVSYSRYEEESSSSGRGGSGIGKDNAFSAKPKWTVFRTPVGWLGIIIFHPGNNRYHPETVRSKGMTERFEHARVWFNSEIPVDRAIWSFHAIFIVEGFQCTLVWLFFGESITLSHSHFAPQRIQVLLSLIAFQTLCVHTFFIIFHLINELRIVILHVMPPCHAPSNYRCRQKPWHKADSMDLQKAAQSWGLGFGGFGSCKLQRFFTDPQHGPAWLQAQMGRSPRI